MPHAQGTREAHRLFSSRSTSLPFFPIHTRRPPPRSIPFLGTPSPSSFHSPHAHRLPPPPIPIVLRIPNMFPNRSPPTARPPSRARPSDDHIHPRTHPYPDPNPHPTNLLPQHTLLPQHSLRPPKPSTPAGWSYSSHALPPGRSYWSARSGGRARRPPPPMPSGPAGWSYSRRSYSMPSG
ncbi:hypothetical protein C8J57DRAFT_276796 [Mycena rebaudengoi]|nr:hypothetical protein C8J57DRAFT_276796 [Mycena rebaudengoi]